MSSFSLLQVVWVSRVTYADIAYVFVAVRNFGMFINTGISTNRFEGIVPSKSVPNKSRRGGRRRLRSGIH